MSSLIHLVRLRDSHEETSIRAFSTRIAADKWVKWANQRLATKLPPHKDSKKVFWVVDNLPTQLDDPTYPIHPL